jgi:hypothetical protein
MLILFGLIDISRGSDSLRSRRIFGGGLAGKKIRVGELCAGGEKRCFSRPPFSPPARSSPALIVPPASPPPKNRLLRKLRIQRFNLRLNINMIQ